MLDTTGLGDFHFLRPGWLAALPLALLLWWTIRQRAGAAERRMRGLIAPHLLAHLRVGGSDPRHFQPIHLVTLLVVLAAVAAAGPTWHRELPPFAEDTAPLVIALDLSQTMDATDVQPSRLERAKQKLHDLLALRQGSRTALIAYAGTPHTVLPLCDDTSVFELFIDGLATDIMPMPGNDAAAALGLADEILAGEVIPGSILFVTDGVATSHVPAFAAHAERSRDAVLVLAVGTRDGGPIRIEDGRFATDRNGRRIMATVDVEGLEALADEAGAFVTGATTDATDVRRLQRRVQSHLRQVQQESLDTRWRDAGYYLVLPLAILGLLWFRRGWTVSWTGAFLATMLLGGCGSDDRSGPTFTDLWLSADQQGRRSFEQQEYAAAAEHFADPMWKGVAFYRAGELETAIEWFAQVASPEADFNLGNADAGLSQLEAAIVSYDAALTGRPDWPEAVENRQRVLALLAALDTEGEEEPPPPGDPSLPPDEIVFDERGEQGDVGEIETEQLTDENIAEIWLRRLQSSPADFLRRRFAAEMVQAVERAREQSGRRAVEPTGDVDEGARE